MLLKIVSETKDNTVCFAAEELKKYIKKMNPQADVLNFAPESLTENDNSSIVLKVDESMLPDGCDSTFDDAIAIDVAGGSGTISGSNPRSVLIAVYRFLKELGCAWIRPGEKGEYIPEKQIDSITVKVKEFPSYRHRGITIEGAVSYENVVDMIDWIPKVGMNSYFIQFPGVPYTFYDRWYSHLSNEILKPESLTEDEVKAIRLLTEKEIKKRGLLYHTAGHGWTCEPFGISGNSWDPKEVELTEEQQKCMALVNGKRELWKGISLNTNLCYSNAAVRRTIVEAIENYIVENPSTDVIHVWLADGVNNHCECPECVKQLPSEWYIRLLNEIDRSLTEKSMKQKIVFLLYFDLLWPPVHEKLNSPDRFIMMFAPITRTYSKSISRAGNFDKSKLPEYKRNRLSFPRSVEENIAWLKKWQKQIKCDSFDFDYHYMWDHFYDPGYYQMAKVLLDDINGLKSLGLNGYLSCQNQRVWFPSGLGMHLMAEGLWNINLDFEDAAGQYFNMAFGRDGNCVKEYLSKLSEAFDPVYLRRENGPGTEKDAKRLHTVQGLIESFIPVIEDHLRDTDIPESIRQSWKILESHSEYCNILSEALIAEIEEPAVYHERMQEFYQWCKENEIMLQDVLDVYEVQQTYKRREDNKDIFSED